MSQSNDETTLSVWAITKELRRGILIGILALLVMAVVYLFIDGSNTKKEYQKKLEAQNEQLLNILIPSIKKVNHTVNTVDTLAKRADSTLTVLNDKNQ